MEEYLYSTDTSPVDISKLLSNLLVQGDSFWKQIIQD